jgi:hypothetical protein
VKAGGGGADAEGEGLAECLDKGVAAAAIVSAHCTKVVFEVAALDHRREGGLFDDRWPGAAGLAAVGDIVREVGG